MSTNFPSAYDMLSLSGVLPYDVNQIIFDTPSPYLQQSNLKLPASTPQKDVFNPNGKTKTPTDPRKIGLAALATYITGVILSKGSKNPIKGLQAIGSTLLNIIKLPLKVLKK